MYVLHSLSDFCYCSVVVVSCNWFFPANHKSVLVLFLFTCILYCFAFLLLREAFLRMRIPSYSCLNLYNSPYANVRFLPVTATCVLNIRMDVGTNHTPARVWGDNVKLALVMLPWVCAHHSTAPEHWSYAIALQVEHIVMAHIASKGNLQ